MCAKCFLESSTCIFPQASIRTIGRDNCDFDALAFAALLKPSCQREGGFIDGDRKPCSLTLSDDCVPLVKVGNGLAKLDCLIDIK